MSDDKPNQPQAPSPPPQQDLPKPPPSSPFAPPPNVPSNPSWEEKGIKPDRIERR